MDKKLIEALGGDTNIISVMNCMTRVRFIIKDDSKIDKEKVKDIQGVLGYVVSGNQHQVIVGPGKAKKVADAIAKDLNLTTETVD